MRRQRRIYLYPRFRGFLPGGSARCEILPSPFPWISAGGVGAGTFAPGAGGAAPPPVLRSRRQCLCQAGWSRPARIFVYPLARACPRPGYDPKPPKGGFRFTLSTEDERGAPSYIYKHSYMDIYSV